MAWMRETWRRIGGAVNDPGVDIFMSTPGEIDMVPDNEFPTQRR
jgi:hypothetical protein